MTARSNARDEEAFEPVRQGGHVAEMQRRRLLHAMGEVVGGRGVDGLTVGRVCEQAGVSRRTFYEQFDDCEGCLIATLDAQVERLAREIRRRYARRGKWRERVRDALSWLLGQLDAEPNVARLCVIETLRGGPAVLERRARVLDCLATVVDEGRGEARAGSDPPPLTAQGIVGGALSVIHARLLESAPATGHPSGDQAENGTRAGNRRSQGTSGAQRSLVELTGPLMAMIVHPYLGPAAARAELERPVPTVQHSEPRQSTDPFKGLPIRFTYRTARVLATIAEAPGASNRHIADHSGIADEGQISRLLGRLSKCELVENSGRVKGEPNAWQLTQRGHAIHDTITARLEIP
jgi:AcrR family transcriptional regulator